jgi:broad specificity phosphatase PhoE
VYRRWLAFEFDAAFPGGESFLHARDRFSRALKKAATQEGTLLVTHGGITTTVVPLMCVNAAALQHIEVLDNTGFIVLETYDPDRYSCLAWNLVEHLT